jgi:hypothetical protein
MLQPLIFDPTFNRQFNYFAQKKKKKGFGEKENSQLIFAAALA